MENQTKYDKDMALRVIGYDGAVYRSELSQKTRYPVITLVSSDFRIVADYFVHSRTDPDYRPKDPVKFQHVDELLKLMSALTQDQRFVETTQEEGGKPGDMCELLDRVEAKGIKLGIEQGIDANRIDSIKSLMKNLNLTAAQAMNVLEIPSIDQIKYAGRL